MRSGEDARLPRRASSEPPLVIFERASAGYGRQAVLHEVDLRLAVGQFAGIVGPSGSGKTTLLRALLGIVPITGGRLTVDGAAVRGLAPAGVGYVPQLETVDWSFPVTVEQVVLMGRRGAHGWPWPSRVDRRAVAAMLERLGIADQARKHIRDLSGGQQQRVFLARALVSQPRLLLLDEPTSGVDVKTRHDILHLLDELNAEGVTIVLTTHDLNAIAAHLPWVVCLNGRLIAEGPPAEVLTSDVLRRTYGAEMTVLTHEGHLLIVDASTLKGLHEPIGSVVWSAR